MKRSAWIIGICLLTATAGWADLKSDVLAFTGTRTKLVWRRYKWAQDNYQPKPKPANIENVTELVLFDTDEGAERVIDATPAGHNWTRISRSGKWVVWNDKTEKCSYIADLTGTPNKRKLITTGIWFVGAVWVDPASKAEYVYCLDNFNTSDVHGTDMYKVPLTSAGVAEVDKKVKVASGKFDNTYGVSADGKKIGCAHPWPDTYIFDVAANRYDSRDASYFGCQANLAPDNSYRYAHCDDEHEKIHMWAANMSTTNWTVSLNQGLPFNTWKVTGENSPAHDSPRWSNHAQFFTTTYPIFGYGSGDAWAEDLRDIWSLTATQVQTTVRQDHLSTFHLGKFSSDFKTVEKYIPIAADIRQWNWGGDAWLSNGVTSGAATAVIDRIQTIAARGVPATLRTVDVRGRTVHCASAASLRSAAGSAAGAGVYFSSANDGRIRSIDVR